MEAVSDIPVVQVPALQVESAVGAVSPGEPGVWALEVPRQRRPSPVTLAALGVVAGIGAMVLGAVAVVSAGRADERSPSQAAVATPRDTPAGPSVEQRVLALLAKPSTARVTFRNSGGALVLAVGSGGRAAILLRGFERAPAGHHYRAWLLAPGEPPVHAAAFRGTERAVFLSVPVVRDASVVVAGGARVPVRLSASAIAATRG